MVHKLSLVFPIEFSTFLGKHPEMGQFLLTFQNVKGGNEEEEQQHSQRMKSVFFSQTYNTTPKLFPVQIMNGLSL